MEDHVSKLGNLWRYVTSNDLHLVKETFKTEKEDLYQQVIHMKELRMDFICK